MEDLESGAQMLQTLDIDIPSDFVPSDSQATDSPWNPAWIADLLIEPYL